MLLATEVVFSESLKKIRKKNAHMYARHQRCEAPRLQEMHPLIKKCPGGACARTPYNLHTMVDLSPPPLPMPTYAAPFLKRWICIVGRIECPLF